MTEFVLAYGTTHRRPDLAGRLDAPGGAAAARHRAVELNAGRCPSVSQPAALAGLLAQI